MDVVYPVEYWSSDSQPLPYADYWNDEGNERDKPFWILDGDFGKMERYIEGLGLVQQLEQCVAVAKDRFGRELRGTGCDLAAGALWAEPHLFRLGRLDRLYCVEFSRHRLTQIGPRVLQHYNVAPEKVTLAIGDIHQLKLPDASLDFVFMAEAFHHSGRPSQLLREFRRVLRPNGIVILIGEPIADWSWKDYLKQPLRFVAARLPRSLQRGLLGIVFETNSPLPSDRTTRVISELGDHLHTRSQYERMFSEAGFSFAEQRRPHWNSQAFVLYR